jgi:hypothetical protein
MPKIEAFLRQSPADRVSFDDALASLSNVVV